MKRWVGVVCAAALPSWGEAAGFECLLEPQVGLL